ncbi:MAG: L-threonylcarbamoyladenylate synthase [Pseudomonadota bacterium]|nr:L-threonylcarbamoyladenylate synthase [Pseudomonadota bacterium]
MTKEVDIQKAKKILLSGGIIAYPTEGVFGIGCLPNNEIAIKKIIKLKQRNQNKGFILIASDLIMLNNWISPTTNELKNLCRISNSPITWIVCAAPKATDYLTGGRSTIAVRITKHPVVKALCESVGSAIISTSANLSGEEPIKSKYALRKLLQDKVDLIVTGELTDSLGPSEIRIAKNNHVLRDRQKLN